jgi:hypothetical protein
VNDAEILDERREGAGVRTERLFSEITMVMVVIMVRSHLARQNTIEPLQVWKNTIETPRLASRAEANPTVAFFHKKIGLP